MLSIRETLRKEQDISVHNAQRGAKTCLFFMALVICSFLPVFAQNQKLTGLVIDSNDKQPVIGAYVIAQDRKDTSHRLSVTTDINGKFLLSGLKQRNYNLTIQSISYARFSRMVEIKQGFTDLGAIELTMDSKVLKEVVIVGQGTAVQKGDTTIMTAEAFKVNPNANAEDLVKKMPGITVENGTVKAQGDEVKKVLVDGKPFFGDDPSVALRNLPADVIDRVQVYNKLSDQAELTGFDDGSSSRTINIITRKDHKISQFGKFTGGTDFSDKYLVAGNLNIFKGPRRFTFTGMSNNVNMQNFAMQDLLGSSGGGGGRGHGGQGGFGYGSFFGAGGISRNSSLGMNYTDNWGKKVAVTGSYFYNASDNTLIQESNTEYLFTVAGKYATSNSTSISKNYNHRLNLRIEYNIDSLNSIILVPRLNIQDNSNNSISLYSASGGGINTQTNNSIYNDATGYNLSSDLTWRHKFLKKGRTLSVRSSINQNKNNSENTQIASVDSIPDNLYTDGMTKGFSVNTNVKYTEPISKYSMLQANYNNSFNRGSTDKETYRIDGESEMTGRLDSLSNVMDNDYITNRGGLSYLFKNKDLRFSAGMDYQLAVLTGDQTFPQKMAVNKTFQNILPNLMINYKMSDLTNLRFSYRTSTNAPSINQLQNVLDNSNRLSISTGNPGLKQEYSHNMMTNLAYANPTTGFNAFLYLSGSYTRDDIASRIIYARRDTLNLPEFNVILLPGGQLSYPVNMDHAMNIRTFVNLAYFIKPLKSNLNFVAGGSYAQLPGYIDSLLNRSNTYSITNSLILTSNISSNLDFTLSYTSNYSMVKNSARLEYLDDTRYWYQSASGKINWIFWKGFVLNTDFLYQYNQGLSQGYNQRYFVWNASMGKRFLKNQAAEFRLGVYDILNQNSNISRTVTASAITDTHTNAFQRYFLVLFTYNLKSKYGQPQQQQQEHQHEHHDGIPGGMPPGGLPPGTRPGGGPPPDFHRD
jgi:hypothetical protein